MVSKYIHNPDMKFIDILGKAAYFSSLLHVCLNVFPSLLIYSTGEKIGNTELVYIFFMFFFMLTTKIQ